MVADGEMAGLVGWEDGADLWNGGCEINSQGLFWGCKGNWEGEGGVENGVVTVWS